MSHMLSTVNPEAAADEHEVPEVGSRVIYFGRPGMLGVNGQKQFAADVIATDPAKGTCVLWVLRGREDYQEQVHVRRRSEQNPYGCWDYVEDGFEDVLEYCSKLEKQVEVLEHDIKTLHQAIFGSYAPPANKDGTPKSIIDILAEFEQKVFAATGAKGKTKPR
jgi:hypothetical protein